MRSLRLAVGIPMLTPATPHRPSTPAALSQLADVGCDVAGLETRQVHIRNLGVRVEQKCRKARFAEIRPSGDLLERRRIGGGLTLVKADHMARGAPPLR